MFDFLFGNSQRIPLREKWEKIITSLNNDGRAIILKEKRSYIAWGCVDMFAKTVFSITDNEDGFIKIEWLSESFLGKHTLSWTFNEREMPEIMLIDIGMDIKNYWQSVYEKE